MGELRVLSGRPAVLREAFAQRVVELRREDPLSPISVLVGASLQRPHLQRWLAARLGGHANVRVLLPGDLALLLGSRALIAAGRRALPPLADRVLLAEVARAHPGYFAPVADTPGFAEALFRLVRELRGAGLELSALRPLLAGATDAPEKATALAEILHDFEARRAGFYGPDDALAVADVGLLDGLGLLVWGVLDLQPAMRRLLQRIATRLPVEVFVPELPATNDAPLGALRARLLAAGARAAELAGGSPPHTTLERVRRRLFTTPSGPPLAADGTVRLVSAPDPAREVAAAARACLQWAREGVRFWEMAVAYRHGEAYRPLVESVFIEAGIPVYLHEGSPLAERPVGRQTLALLDLFESDLSRQSVMDFLTDAQLPHALREEFDGAPATRWDSVSRQAGIVAGIEQWRQRLALLQADLAGDEGSGNQPQWVAERIADAANLARFIDDLSGRLAAHPDHAPWSAQLDFLERLLSRYVQGAEQVVAALRGLERFTALEDEVSFERFLEVVKRAIGTLRSEEVLQGDPGAFARRGVNVVAVASLAGIEFARVWILGATERLFPPPARQDPILLDSERAVVSARSGSELPPRAARGTEEALQFALACEAARERLVVSYARRATGESRPRLPSVFFCELASQLEGRRVTAEQAPLLRREDVQRIAGDAIGAPIPGGRYATDRRLVSSAAAGAISAAERDRTYLQARVTRPLAIATFERAAPAFARARAKLRARWSDRYSEWDGALSERAREAVARLLGDERTYSPTALEEYAACPQRFLMGHLLRVRAVQEPERTFEIDPPHRGNLYHRIFERFHSEWGGPGPAALAPDAAGRMRAIAEQECDAAERRGETGYPALWAATRLEVIDDCLRWLAQERENPLTRALPNVACEARFGRRHPAERRGTLSREEPLELELDGQRLRLAGRIDRINWSDDRRRFRVVDYKTGKVRSERSGELQGGRMLQLPLYVLAGAALLGAEPAGGQAAYVYPTRRGQFATVAWSGEDLAARRDEVLALVAAILEGVARGDFMVAPWDPAACRHCEFDPICPRGRADYLKRKAGDGRLAAFATAIRGIK